MVGECSSVLQVQVPAVSYLGRRDRPARGTPSASATRPWSSCNCRTCGACGMGGSPRVLQEEARQQRRERALAGQDLPGRRPALVVQARQPCRHVEQRRSRHRPSSNRRRRLARRSGRGCRCGRRRAGGRCPRAPPRRRPASRSLPRPRASLRRTGRAPTRARGPREAAAIPPGCRTSRRRGSGSARAAASPAPPTAPRARRRCVRSSTAAASPRPRGPRSRAPVPLRRRATPATRGR